ncbi:GNAT family N-acetyltransferase [Tardisphaera miroshnichenkoae]
MIIRRYRDGDEEGIVTVMNKSFATFNQWGLTPEKWMRYEKIDPGFSREKAFVAESEGRIASHVQMVRREMNFGKFVVVSGVANVCTDPDFRSKGLATQVLQEALRDAAEWSALSGLDTGYASGAHRIYRRLGFSPFHFFRRFSGERWEVERATKRLKMFAGDLVSQVRSFKPEDKQDVERIYSANAEKVRGSCKRDPAYWEGKLFGRNSWQTFFYREFNAEEVLVLPGRAYAYLDWDETARRLTVREALSMPGDKAALAAVYAKALSLKEEVNEVVLVAPEGDQSVDSLLTDFYQFRVLNSFMLSILKPAELLRQLGNGEAGTGKRVKLQLYNDVRYLEPVTIGLKNFLPVGDESLFDAAIYAHQSTFMRMVGGLEDPIEALTSDKLVVSGDGEGVVAALRDRFQRHPFVLWPSDRWRRFPKGQASTAGNLRLRDF